MLSKEYKEREPQETITIIKKFFQDKGCSIIENLPQKSESGTYSNTYQLLLNGKIISSSSGKGIDEIYCRASGLAELYERFCAFPTICYNPINYLKYEKANMKKNNYHISKDEKLLSYQDIMDEPNSKRSLEYFIKELNQTSVDLQLKATFGKSELYGSPYYSFDGKVKKYINSTLATLCIGTTGLAAGNTLEEALVQGSSELYERYCLEQLLTKRQDKYYYLNNNNLPDKIKKVINNIENLEYKIYLYDLSYNFNIPVFMVLVLNPKTHLFYKHLGSHPIANIAMERCLTELYQGRIKLFKDNEFKMPTPSNNINSNDLLSMSMHSQYPNEIIIEDLIFHSEQIEKESNIYFNINKLQNNNDLLKHIQNINKINNIEFYYQDISLMDEIKAVHILPNQIYNCGGNLEFEEFKTLKENSEYDRCLFIWQNLHSKIINDIFNNRKIEEEEIENLINSLKYKLNPNIELAINDLFFISNFFNYDIITASNVRMTNNDNNNFNLLLTLLNKISKIDINYNTDFGKMLLPWNLFIEYVIKQNYTKEDYLKIIKFLGYTENDIELEKEFSIVFFIKYAIYNNLLNLYNSTHHNQFINLFIKGVENGK